MKRIFSFLLTVFYLFSLITCSLCAPPDFPSDEPDSNDLPVEPYGVTCSSYSDFYYDWDNVDGRGGAVQGVLNGQHGPFNGQGKPLYPYLYYPVKSGGDYYYNTYSSLLYEGYRIGKIEIGPGLKISAPYRVHVDDYVKTVDISASSLYMSLYTNRGWASYDPKFVPNIIPNFQGTLNFGYIDLSGIAHDLGTWSVSGSSSFDARYFSVNDYVFEFYINYDVTVGFYSIDYSSSNVTSFSFGLTLISVGGPLVSYIPLSELDILGSVLSQLDDIASSLGTDVNTLLRQILAAIQGQTDYTPQLQAILDALKSLSFDNGTTVDQLAKILSQLKDLTDVTEAGWQAPSGDLVDSELFTEVMDELLDHIDDLNQQIASDTVRPPPDQIRPSIPDALNPTDETARTSLSFVGELFANPLILSMLTVIFTLAIVRLVFFGRSNK